MTDWIALCEALAESTHGRGGVITIGWLCDALTAAAAELRRQRDAAQESGEEGREGASWAATTNGADSSHAAASDPCAPSPAPISPQACADCAEREANARRERDELKAEIERLKDELRLVTSPHESVGSTLAALKAERDEARARLRELEPLVAKVVEQHAVLSDAGAQSCGAVGALVLHERRRAKERSDGE